MKSWTWKDLALAVLGNLFTAALTFLLTITIGRQLDMDTRLILLALAAFALAGSALMAFFLKRQGLRLCFVVADHEQRLVSGFPVVCHDTVLILKDRKQIAVYDSFAISRILTQRKQAAVVLINGIRIIFLTFQIDLCVIAVYLQPWSAGCKTCIRGSIPLERSPGIITADAVYGL